MGKVPLAVGFIFPDGSFIQTGGIGHCKCAMRYIIDNNLEEDFKKAYCAEDDYLIEYLGAAKITKWRGTAYMFLPKHYGWYLNEMKKIYMQAGYKIKFCHNSVHIIIDNEPISYIISYNKTVCKKIDRTTGKIIYCYNPNRNGD